MTWEITLFYWTGFLLFEVVMMFWLLGLAYYLWNRILKSLPFYWRVGVIAHIMTDKNHTWKDGKTFKDKNGKTYKIVEVKK